MSLEAQVTTEDLLKRKRSFFASYEINVNMWDAEGFDPTVDFFDLEDMLASRYWLKRLKQAGKLTKEEEEKLRELDLKFKEQGVPQFVREHFPQVYERWIREAERTKMLPANIEHR